MKQKVTNKKLPVATVSVNTWVEHLAQPNCTMLRVSLVLVCVACCYDKDIMAIEFEQRKLITVE